MPLRTLVQTQESKGFVYDGILLIDTPCPSLPPKDPKFAPYYLPKLEFESDGAEKTGLLSDTGRDIPPRPEPAQSSPPPVYTPELSPEPEEDEEPTHPWSRRRLACSAQDGPRARAHVFPRSDFSLSTSGAAASGLNLFGGLGDDHAQNDTYSISVPDLTVSRLFTMGDVPRTRFGHGSAFAGSVVIVWGGDTVSASTHQLRARAKYDNGLYFLNLGKCPDVASYKCRNATDIVGC